MSKYMLPSEIKTETQMMSWLYLGDILFIAGYVGFFSIFSGLVHPILIMPYMIWNALIGLILTRPSPYNPPKRIYHSVFLRVTKKVMAYQSIPLEEEGHFDEIAYKKKQGA